MEPRLRASHEQFSLLLDFMERHGDLSRNRLGLQGRIESDRLWEKLTILLNSLGGGVQKPSEKWKKVWADWKTKTKKKHLGLRLQPSGTGGGSSRGITLTAMEKRVVAVIRKATLVGQPGIQEQSFNKKTTNEPVFEAESEPSIKLELDVVLEDYTQNTAVATSTSPAISYATTPTLPGQHISPTVVLETSATATQLSPSPRPSTPPPPPRTPPALNNRRQASRRAFLRARRNSVLSQFGRAAEAFFDIERRRLDHEEARDRRLHEREIERLRLEAERMQVTREQTKKRERQSSPSPALKQGSDDNTPVVPKRKKIQVHPMDPDGSLAENEVDDKSNICSEKKLPLEKKLQDSFKYEPKQSPNAKKPSMPVTKPTSSNGQTTSPPKPVEETSSVPDEDNWVHCKLDWLKPDKIRDAQKRRPDHPDYDSTTLYVPPDFYKSQTAVHKQWWELKSSHFDCVLFFKWGKFYQLYHMDAVVGVNELGFAYVAKDNFAHTGFPESAYDNLVSTLVSKGYKVARVEQTETPDMMQERCKRSGQNTKWDKVVRREICQVTMRGTQVCGLQDSGPADSNANYLMAIAEEATNGTSNYGVCFVDTSIGQLHLGQFEDDKHSSRLLTTLAHFPPALVSDALGLTPAANCYLAIKALGGCISCLTKCFLDIQILGMAQFTSYTPPDVLNKTLIPEDKSANRWKGSSTMVLDAVTLRNLRIIEDEGCLYERLNFCSTNMGKRLLYQWVCAPSCNLSVIKERQEAVKTLFENQELCEDVKNLLTTLPDLERLLAKVHALGNLKRSKQHPDSRAIFYEEKTYSKRKVLDFISVLNGFTTALELIQLFADVDAVLLKRIMQFSPKGQYPDYRDTLAFFKEAFNQAEAEKEGRILPGEGVDQEYDNTLTLIKEIDEELKDYLKEQEKHFKCRLNYVGTDKKRYQIEVPENAASKAGSDYNLEGTRKGFKKFSTAETKGLLARMIAAEEQKTNVLRDLSRRIFEKFSSHYNQWKTAVQCLSTLDILLAFTEFARQQSGDVCLPEITYNDNKKPYMNIIEGRHPCIPNINDFIPNDTQLGTEDPSLLLLTGPNMGGKSTLMRQAGLITVLAHLGSYVPAQECSLSLVDRIFTRLGASDDIFSGQSTFLVEMNETAAIVKHATEHSLVLLDELGRGTSTYDGTAIASGVCVELARRACRVIFSTHYHSLVHHLASHRGVILGHMACMVETDESTPDDADHIPEETITFLYKLSPGACPKSYGFNAARLAGIPKDITLKAHRISKNLEKEATCVRAFRDLLKIGDNPNDLRSFLSSLTI